MDNRASKPSFRQEDGEPGDARIRAFISTNLPLTTLPFLPEIRLHKAVPTSRLGRLAAEDADFGTPYWAYLWSGGLALARYILDNPGSVAGKRVVDVGTGSGLLAIAAGRAGASEIIAADVDEYAIAAAGLNAEANSVAIRTEVCDVTTCDRYRDFDLVLVGDLFYDCTTSERLIRFLDTGSSSPRRILVGDPGRAYLPAADLKTLASYRVCEISGAVADTAKPSTVFEYNPRQWPMDRESGQPQVEDETWGVELK